MAQPLRGPDFDPDKDIEDWSSDEDEDDSASSSCSSSDDAEFDVESDSQELYQQQQFFSSSSQFIEKPRRHRHGRCHRRRAPREKTDEEILAELGSEPQLMLGGLAATGADHRGAAGAGAADFMAPLSRTQAQIYMPIRVNCLYG